MKKVFFLYKTRRRDIYNNWKRGEGPDTLLYGFNHMEKFGFQATFSDLGFTRLNPIWVLSYPLYLIMAKVGRIGFHLSQALTLFPILNRYDFIVSTMDSAGLPVLFLKKIGLLKAKVIYISVGIADNLDTQPKFLKKFYKSLFQKAENIICYSQEEAKVLNSLNENVEIMMPGVDISFYKNPGEKKNRKIKKVLAFGKDKDRDYESFLKAVEVLNIKPIIVAGKKNLESFKIPNKVTVFIDIPSRELKEIIFGADIVVIPVKQVKRAAGQLSILDSLASGKPIIVPEIESIKSSFGFRDRMQCLYYKPEDPGDLKKKITLLLGDEKLQNNISREAVKKSKEYSTQIFAKKLAAILRSYETTRQ